MKRLSASGLLVFWLVLFLAASGCQKLENFASEGAPVKVGISLDIDFAAILKSGGQSQNRVEERNFFAGPVFSTTVYNDPGSMLRLLNAADEVVYEFDVSAEIDDQDSTDDNDWNLKIYQTFLVKLGSYKFDLVFKKEGQQYAGLSGLETLTEGENQVDLTVKPIIGETVTSAAVAEEIALYVFNYDEDELVGMTNPELRVTVDGGAVQIFELDASGDASTYFNLDGTHDILIELWADEGKQAKYADAAEEFVPGTKKEINLTPLYAKVKTNLTVEGGDALFGFTFPAAVIDEAGGDATNDLEARFALSSAKNACSGNIPLAANVSGDYEGSITCADMHYDSSVDVAIDFYDLNFTPNEKYGYCSYQYDLDTSADMNQNCDITLNRRSEITGNVYFVLGVNVLNSSGTDEGVAGSKVYKVVGGGDDELLGITGTDAFMGDQFVEVLLIEGTHDIYAVDATGDNPSATMTINADANEVDTVTLNLTD